MYLWKNNLQVIKSTVHHIRFFMFSLAVLGHFSMYAQPAPSREYQLKAVFLFNFTQFVDWPPDAFVNDQAPLVIGILGNNPFGPFLESTVSGETVKGHPVIIRQYTNAGEIKDCHILFVNIEEQKKREDIISAVKGRNILTVSDAPGFAQQGGIVCFVNADNKIKLQINAGASKTANLVISSKLLRLAEIFNY